MHSGPHTHVREAPRLPGRADRQLPHRLEPPGAVGRGVLHALVHKAACTGRGRACAPGAHARSHIGASSAGGPAKLPPDGAQAQRARDTRAQAAARSHVPRGELLRTNVRHAAPFAGRGAAGGPRHCAVGGGGWRDPALGAAVGAFGGRRRKRSRLGRRRGCRRLERRLGEGLWVQVRAFALHMGMHG